MRPKRREIEVATREGPVTIMATEVVPGLAVHPLLLSRGNFSELYHEVTHIPTGRLIRCWLSKRDAFKVARAIADLTDWPALTKVSKKLGRKIHKSILVALA